MNSQLARSTPHPSPKRWEIAVRRERKRLAVDRRLGGRVDTSLYAHLRQSAAANGRSIAGQLLHVANHRLEARRLSKRLMRPMPDVGVRQDFRVDSRHCDLDRHPELTPIVINNFNRLDYLRRLVAALNCRGYENVYVIDNNSDYEPLLEYYEHSGLRVFRLDRNVGYLSMWTTPIGMDFVDSYYVYTDADIEPVEECPDDFVSHFRDVLSRYSWVHKVGFGLKIDDLPSTYDLRSEVVEHERQFERHPVEPGLYRAPIDTTFALYRPGAAGGCWLRSMRTGWPYLARHLPWYCDSSCIDEEEAHFRRTAQTSTHWTSQASDESASAPNDHGESV